MGRWLSSTGEHTAGDRLDTAWGTDGQNSFAAWHGEIPSRSPRPKNFRHHVPFLWAMMRCRMAGIIAPCQFEAVKSDIQPIRIDDSCLQFAQMLHFNPFSENTKSTAGRCERPCIGKMVVFK
jgi:hypothetical protein